MGIFRATKRIRAAGLPLAILACVLVFQSLHARKNEPAGWDPGTVWDGPNPAEPVALFLLGTLVIAPIRFLIIRKAEQQESVGSVPFPKIDGPIVAPN